MNNSGGRQITLLLYKSFLPQMARIWGFFSTFGETEARQHLVTFLCPRSLLDLGALCGNHMWEGMLRALGDSRLLQRLLAAQSLHLQSVDCLGPHPHPLCHHLWGRQPLVPGTRCVCEPALEH